MSKTILDYNTVELDKNDNTVIIIDQTLLPAKTELIKLSTAKEIWDAIYLLKVRGAPAIGVAAAFGLYVLSVQILNEIRNGADVQKDSTANAGSDERTRFYEAFLKQKEYLNSSRPTAVNLSWALNRMDRVCKAALDREE